MTEVVQNGRPKPRSMLSHESRRSIRSSNGSHRDKADITESPKDKKRLNFRSDPSSAINEAQPAAVALEESSLDSIRAMTWKDSVGNIIADPDKSNPTRSRMERPLDTIRSFEAAVEGTYNNRRSTYAGGTDAPMLSNGGNRRSGCFALNGPNGSVRPPQSGGYYQYGRNQPGRPQSGIEDFEGRYSYPPRPMRQGSSPVASNSNTDNFYPVHGHQPSYDTITTAAGSYGTDIRGDSTDPSSHNSSVDRFPVKTEDYSGDRNPGSGYQDGPFSPVSPTYNGEQGLWRGANGRAQASPGKTEYWDGNGETRTQEQRPTVPRKEDQPVVPIKLNTMSNADAMPISPKRHSWFKRRFSKQK